LEADVEDPVDEVPLDEPVLEEPLSPAPVEPLPVLVPDEPVPVELLPLPLLPIALPVVPVFVFPRLEAVFSCTSPFAFRQCVAALALEEPLALGVLDVPLDDCAKALNVPRAITADVSNSDFTSFIGSTPLLRGCPLTMVNPLTSRAFRRPMRI